MTNDPLWGFNFSDHFSFCNDCLSSVENHSGSSTCPVCRDDFNLNMKRRARDIERQIRHSMGTCSGCNRQVVTSLFLWDVGTKGSEHSVLSGGKKGGVYPSSLLLSWLLKLSTVVSSFTRIREFYLNTVLNKSAWNGSSQGRTQSGSTNHCLSASMWSAWSFWALVNGNLNFIPVGK